MQLWQSPAALLGREQRWLAQGAPPKGTAAAPWAAAPLLPQRHDRRLLPGHAALSWAPRCSPHSPGPVAPVPPWLPCPRGSRAPAPLLHPRGCSPHQGCCWVPATAGAMLSQKPQRGWPCCWEWGRPGADPSRSPRGCHCCGWKPFTATAATVRGARLRAKAARPPLLGNIKDTGHGWCRGWGKRGSTWSRTLALLWH